MRKWIRVKLDPFFLRGRSRTRRPQSLTREEKLCFGLAAPREWREEHAATLTHAIGRANHADLFQHLRLQGLVPLLGSRVLALDPNTPAGFAAGVRAEVRATTHVALMHLALLDGVQRILTEAGIQAVPLKGIALGTTVHQDIGLRPTGDLDLLVDVAHLDHARALLTQMGYVPNPEPFDRSGRPQLHYRLLSDGLPPIELHWRLHWYEARFAGELLERASPHAELGWALDPIDELTALMLFYARDGFVGLRLAADLAAWWDQYGAPGTRAELECRLTDHPSLQAPVAAAASVLARNTHLEIRAAGLPLSRRGRIAARLANPALIRDPQQIRAEVHLVDGLLSPPGEAFGFVRRWVLPPLHVVLSRQPELATQSRARQRFAQFQIPFRMGRRWLMALIRLARRPGHETDRA